MAFTIPDRAVMVVLVILVAVAALDDLAKTKKKT